jgi:hypothetical protein
MADVVYYLLTGDSDWMVIEKPNISVQAASQAKLISE